MRPVLLYIGASKAREQVVVADGLLRYAFTASPRCSCEPRVQCDGDDLKNTKHRQTPPGKTYEFPDYTYPGFPKLYSHILYT